MVGDRLAKSVQDRRVHTRLTLGSHRDRRLGHSSDRTLCRASRPHHRLAGAGPVRAGQPPEVTDPELVCLAVAQVLLRYDHERHWLRVARSRVGHLFPRLLGQSEYNQRLKNTAPLMEAALRWLADQTPGSAEMLRLMDATSVPCGQSVITARRSDLSGWAGYGYCPSHSR